MTFYDPKSRVVPVPDGASPRIAPSAQRTRAYFNAPSTSLAPTLTAMVAGSLAALASAWTIHFAACFTPNEPRDSQETLERTERLSPSKLLAPLSLPIAAAEAAAAAPPAAASTAASAARHLALSPETHLPIDIEEAARVRAPDEVSIVLYVDANWTEAVLKPLALQAARAEMPLTVTGFAKTKTEAASTKNASTPPERGVLDFGKLGALARMGVEVSIDPRPWRAVKAAGYEPGFPLLVVSTSEAVEAVPGLCDPAESLRFLARRGRHPSVREAAYRRLSELDLLESADIHRIAKTPNGMSSTHGTLGTNMSAPSVSAAFPLKEGVLR